MCGGGGGRLGCEIFVEPPTLRKSQNGNISHHFLEREKSGNIKERSRKTQGKRQDDHTEVC
jgi:hypothetical protein